MAHSEDYKRIYATETSGLGVSEIAACLHESTADVGLLCTSPLINQWAKYKPVRSQTKGVIDEDTRKEMNYGFGFVPRFSSIERMCSAIRNNWWAYADNYIPGATPWTYDRPDTRYRVLDFDGYYHGAEDLMGVDLQGLGPDPYTLDFFRPLRASMSIPTQEEGALRPHDFKDGWLGVCTLGSLEGSQDTAIADLWTGSAEGERFWDADFSVARTPKGTADVQYCAFISSRRITRIDDTNPQEEGIYIPLLSTLRTARFNVEAMVGRFIWDPMFSINTVDGGITVEFNWWAKPNGSFKLEQNRVVVYDKNDSVWADVQLPTLDCYYVEGDDGEQYGILYSMTINTADGSVSLREFYGKYGDYNTRYDEIIVPSGATIIGGSVLSGAGYYDVRDASVSGIMNYKGATESYYIS